MEIFLFLIVFAACFWAIWSAIQSFQSMNKSAPNRPRYRNGRSDAGAYLFQAQMARSQHNRGAENFFLMGAMDTTSEPDDGQDEDDQDDGYNEEESYDEYDQ